MNSTSGKHRPAVLDAEGERPHAVLRSAATVLGAAGGSGVRGEGAGRDQAGGLAALPTSAFPETRSLGPGSVPEIPESSLQSWELGAIITPHLGNGEQSLREAGSLA